MIKFSAAVKRSVRFGVNLVCVCVTHRVFRCEKNNVSLGRSAGRSRRAGLPAWKLGGSREK